MMMTGKHFFRAGREGRWSWQASSSTGCGTRTRVCLKDWSSNAFEDKNQMSQRNAIGSIHSVEIILGKVNGQLYSDVAGEEVDSHQPSHGPSEGSGSSGDLDAYARQQAR